MRHPDSYRFDTSLPTPPNEIDRISAEVAQLTADGDVQKATEILVKAQEDGLSLTAIMGTTRFLLSSGKLKGTAKR